MIARVASVALLVGCTTPSPIGPDPKTAPVPVVTATASVAPKAERAFRACKQAPEQKPPFASLRAVDWCNHTFVHGFCELRGGTFEMHEYAELGGMHDTILCRLGNVSYGDVDGDGVEEAAVVVDEENFFTSGASSRGSTVYLYALDKGAIVSRSTQHVPFEANARIEGGKLVLPP